MSRKEIGSEKSGLFKLGIMANSGRLGYLDNLRSFALLLGILFHVSIVYSDEIKYAIQNNERSYLLSYFCYFIHGFRMPLFFMISGFFSALVIERKGGFEFLKARILRVVIPMVFGLVFLSPIQYYLMQKIKNPNLEVLTFILDFFTVDKFEHSHIWFLVNLSLYSFLFYLLPKSFFKNLPCTLTKNGFIFLTFYFIFNLLLLSIFHYFYPKGESIVGISKLTFVYQFFFFLLGIFSYYQNFIFEKTPTSLGLPFLFLSFCAIFVFLAFKELEVHDQMWISYRYVSFYWRTLHLGLWILGAILWSIICIQLFSVYFSNKTKLGEYLIEASLPIYLLHHPLSLFFAFLFFDRTEPIWIKMVLHLLFVVFFCLVLYEVLIRRWNFLRILFGLKPLRS